MGGIKFNQAFIIAASPERDPVLNELHAKLFDTTLRKSGKESKVKNQDFGFFSWLLNLTS